MNVVYWIRGQQYADMAALSIDSVRRCYPGAKIWAYSDTDIHGAIRCLAPTGPAMVANLEAFATFMLASPHGENVLFLDADVLLRKRFPFGVEDLYVTWRTTTKAGGGKEHEHVAKLMPYNFGVLGAVVTPASIEAFLWMRNRVMAMADRHQEWYGNQFALAELCGHPSGPSRVPVPRTIHDCEPRLSVARLRCETWNYTPEAVGEDVTDKGALHFKGGRKDMMEAYA